ncbi:MAG: MBL fold metallo-hydrolase [Desulfurococcus sp.]|nr:MBL fold metallo-hydrolase [Desulfurococcus sp.]
MPRFLVVGRVMLSRRGFAGIALRYKSRVYCVDPGGLVEGCDYVICTHMHERHCGQEIQGFPGDRIVSPSTGVVKPGTSLTLGDLSIRVVDAYNIPEFYENPPHPKGSGVGYVLEAGGTRVYFTGDTNLIDDMVNIAGVEVLVVPIGGGSVMTPEEAFEAVKTIRPVIAIPTHFDSASYYYKFRDLVQPYTQVVFLR